MRIINYKKWKIFSLIGATTVITVGSCLYRNNDFFRWKYKETKYLEIDNSYLDVKQSNPFLEDNSPTQTISTNINYWINQSHSNDRKKRDYVVKNLLKLSSSLSDTECHLLKYGLNDKCKVKLARCKELRNFLFLSPPKLFIDGYDNEKSFSVQLRELINKIQIKKTDDCFLTHFQSMNNYYDTNYSSSFSFNEIQIDSFDLLDMNIDIDLEVLLLNVIRHFARLGKEYCYDLILNNILELLHHLFINRVQCPSIILLISSILIELLEFEEIHQSFIHSRWLSTLHSFIIQPNSYDDQYRFILYCMAEKLLSHVDQDDESTFLKYGQLIYPLQTFDEEPVVDVILLHGLQGSLFYSWRLLHSENLTHFCWPKLSLENEEYKYRIIGANFETRLSDWNMKCSTEQKNRSIINRATIIEEELRRLDVGKRPIIWLCHSMGGIILKEILQHNFFDATHSIIFFSVPHFGSPLATLSSFISYVTKPSIEVQNLSKNNHYLLELHASFMEMIRDYPINIISFSENQPTKLSPGYSVVIVPKEYSDIASGNHYELERNHITVCKAENRHDKICSEMIQCMNDVDELINRKRIIETLNDISFFNSTSNFFIFNHFE
ncbi:hypothetical protein SNEBB_005114 [Seison nebaliae]|nr:hypothetical protein SNEBB_005114 [Seison nebaliae]